jgi:hypothetical protein
MSIEAMKQALEALGSYMEATDSEADAEAHSLMAAAFFKLKEAVAEAEKQEPVALEAVYETIIQWDEGGGKRSRRELARRIVALYTTPPAAQRQPLTDAEVLHLWAGDTPRPVLGKNKVLAFARAIEAAHGIGEKK